MKWPFGKAYILGFTGYQDRMVRMRSEMSRIGLDAEVVWMFKSPFYDALETKLNLGFSWHSYFNITIGHYRSIKLAYELGYKSVLIMEDDCRFLIDTIELEKAIESIPNDYDVALLDSANYMCFKEDEHQRLLNGRVNPYWCRCCVKRCSAGCYALSRKGMERFVNIYEDAARGNSQMQTSDQYFEERWMNGLNFYCAFPNIAIQCRTDRNTSGYATIEQIYKSEGLRESDYAPY